MIHRPPVLWPEGAMAWRSGLPFSQDLRERVLAVADGGLRVREVARLFKVSISYVYKALERRAQTGDAAARRGGGSRAPKLSGQARKSGVQGKSVSIGGRRIIKKKKSRTCV